MEEAGKALNALGKGLKLFLKVLLYLFWGLSRVTEVILSEINKLLKRILEDRKK